MARKPRPTRLLDTTAPHDLPNGTRRPPPGPVPDWPGRKIVPPRRPKRPPAERDV